MRSFTSLAFTLIFALASCDGSSGESTQGGGAKAGGETTGTQGGGGSGGGNETITGVAGGMSTTSMSTSSTSSTLTNNGFPDHWPDGLSCGTEPDVTIWEYDPDTYFLRQSLCSNFEGPFVYLLFGEEKVLLQDTGTGAVDLAGAVQGVISEWLAKKGKPSIELVVTHSHSHGDHVGGDGQFANLPNTVVVGTSLVNVQTFFGVNNWPNEATTFELGNRVLDVIPIPGHQSAHVALYDKSRELLFTGDTLYPGRLYVSKWPDYVASIQRLADFVSLPEHPVKWVLGTHIEMTTTPKQDFPMGAQKHPNEHRLELTKETLLELHQAVMDLGQNPQYQEHDDFIIYPL